MHCAVLKDKNWDKNSDKKTRQKQRQKLRPNGRPKQRHGHVSNAVHPRAGLTGLAGGPGSPADAPRGKPPHDVTSTAGKTLEIHMKCSWKNTWNALRKKNLFPFQDPTLLSSMDPAQIAAAVQHCPIPLDSALQVPETLLNLRRR